jgi:hypothetical protein
MVKKVVQAEPFNEAKNIKKYKTIFFWISISVSVVNTLLAKFVPTLNIKLFMDIITFILVIILFLSDYFFKTKLDEAENIRRKDLIDKSFETKIGAQESQEYYDTDDIPSGFGRLLSNIHENSFYTTNIAQRMLKKELPLDLFLVLGLLGLICVGLENIIIGNIVLQVFLSGIFLDKLISIYTLYNQAKGIEDKARSLWVMIKDKNFEINYNDIAAINVIILKYETSITRATLILSQKIYNQINDNLKNQWEDLKKRYEMNHEFNFKFRR